MSDSVDLALLRGAFQQLKAFCKSRARPENAFCDTSCPFINVCSEYIEFNGLDEFAEDMIGPYNYSMIDMSNFMRQMWATDILSNLKKEGCNLSEDEFVIIAGLRYREYLIPSLQNVSIPLNGLNIGEQLSRLKKFAGGLTA